MSKTNASLHSATIPALASASVIGKSIDKIAKSVTEIKELLHTTAIQCILHAQAHGDVTLMEKLYKAMMDTAADGKSVIRAEAMKFWVSQHSPITARNGVWGMKKGWTKDDFKVQEAMDVPFWEFSVEREPNNVSLSGLLKLVTNLTKRLDKAVEEDRFNGDPEIAKATLNNIVQFASKQAEKLTPAQLGDVDNTADEILRRASDSSQEVTEASSSRLIKKVAKAA